MRKIDGTWACETLTELASVLGVSRDTVKSWRSKGLPGGREGYPIPAVIRWLREAGPWRPRGRGDDPLLVGDLGTSPALERYRAARAALAELDLKERERSLVPRDVVHEGLTRIVEILRSAGDKLQRQCGPEAVEILNGALDAAERAVEAQFSVTEEPDEAGPL